MSEPIAATEAPEPKVLYAPPKIVEFGAASALTGGPAGSKYSDAGVGWFDT